MISAELRRQVPRADRSARARIPNQLINGSGYRRGMATNIPRTTYARWPRAEWFLKNPHATNEELLNALMARIKGPDFPTGAQILGTKGIEDAYRTGRGSITMRAVVNVEEIHGRTCLVVTELPYQANPDNLAIKIAELIKDGRSPVSRICAMRLRVVPVSAW